MELLARLAALIAEDRCESVETDTIEIKPVPSDAGSWRKIKESVNAFLNTRGGILVLGVKEQQRAGDQRYVFAGWRPEAEEKVKGLREAFTDRKGRPLDTPEATDSLAILPFLEGQVAVVYVDELAADRKYVFLDGRAYRRALTGDVRLTQMEIEKQEEFREEAVHARELQPVPDMAVGDLDLHRLNDYIIRLDPASLIETLKPNLDAAHSFLERKAFVRDGRVTTLGALVCGSHPADRLGFRCHVHGYVDAPPTAARVVVQDKQDFADNILPLMEKAWGYLLRSTQVGVSLDQGGASRPQYPESLLRETVNNALAHRDYSINRQVIVSVRPGVHACVENPGTFRPNLLIEDEAAPGPLLRILPEPKPRNPKLADVLRVYRKWEGKGIGMATLVNLCLRNEVDLPYYRLGTDGIRLFLPAGRLLDERMERRFASLDAYIEAKLRGNPLSEPQKLVLSYLMKSEWANRERRHTVLLTHDNNHFGILTGLLEAGLIAKDPRSPAHYPIYLADRILMASDFIAELRVALGPAFDSLRPDDKDVLSVVYRHNRYSRAKAVSAKQIAFDLWADRQRAEGIREFDRFYRWVRNAVLRLERAGFLSRAEGRRYEIVPGFRAKHMC
jgi:ATP-dependent DNA helicase RecG